MGNTFTSFIKTLIFGPGKASVSSTIMCELGVNHKQLKKSLAVDCCKYVNSSVSSTFMCGICMDHKPLKKSFAIKGCTHSYCSDCVCEYVKSKIQDKITRISCPVSGCNGSLDPEHCRSILAPKVLDKWGDELCEALISAPDKFYCPFIDCSALLIKGPDFEEIVESECPLCHKMFCAKCMVPWHSGIKCRKFQKLHKEERERNDDLLRQLAQEKRWTRCPKCKFYVERTEGCLFIKCRCGYAFCYNCGARLTSHYCKKCKH
ncbi:E3 ubiquitin-protein ligase RSL1-like [Apium graveolens]|uniref:E3 ubiquitin-protein ligase RSL1-like n=1 Tax=Apium graveolens TaxID=4045 RepID=UPI003D79ED29